MRDFESVLKYFSGWFLKCIKIMQICWNMGNIEAWHLEWNMRNSAKRKKGPFGYIYLDSYGIVSHRWFQPLPKYHNIISLKLIIGTCNKNQTPLTFSQSKTLICCLPSWVSAITKNHKNGCNSLKSMIGTCNKNWTPLSFGHCTTLMCCYHKNGCHLSKIYDRELQ